MSGPPPGWLARLDGMDPSLLAVLATLVRSGDADGGLPLGDLVRGYREILVSRGGEGAWHEAHSFRDSLLEKVQGFVLPRLVAEGWILDAGDHGWDRVVLEPRWWHEVASAREANARLILARAIPPAPELPPPPAPAVLAGGSVLTCADLNKAFKRRRVVRDVSLQLAQGEVVGLLGPNGAGKTTTFYLITGLIRTDRGRILLDGRDITREPMYRRARAGIGYLAQEPSVFRKLTVEQNVTAILETQELSRAERQERLEELLDELSIKHLRKNKAYSLSGGERRRLEITRALVSRPKFMLLDEPFAGVDPIAVHDIQTIVSGLRHRGIGVLITDHNVEQTLEIVDRAYIMFEGSVQASGTVEDLVFNDQVADLYLGPTLTQRLRGRLEPAR
jgi:lipopolysaccharide export system ATP-binding protein